MLVLVVLVVRVGVGVRIVGGDILLLLLVSIFYVSSHDMVVFFLLRLPLFTEIYILVGA